MAVLSLDEVRDYLNDYPQLNRLITGRMASNGLIQFSMRLALDEFNTTPPLIGRYNADNFPSLDIFLKLTLIHVLTSAALLHARNKIAYNDGGYSVETEQQEMLYQRWVQIFRQEVSARIQQLKIALNIEGGWGDGLGSEYAYTAGWYGW